MGKWWTTSDGEGGGGVVTRSCDSEIKVDEQCHLTNFGDSEGLEITENLRNYFKLIISWGLLWVFQKLLPQKQIDI